MREVHEKRTSLDWPGYRLGNRAEPNLKGKRFDSLRCATMKRIDWQVQIAKALFIVSQPGATQEDAGVLTVAITFGYLPYYIPG